MNGWATVDAVEVTIFSFITDWATVGGEGVAIGGG